MEQPQTKETVLISRRSLPGSEEYKSKIFKVKTGFVLTRSVDRIKIKFYEVPKKPGSIFMIYITQKQDGPRMEIGMDYYGAAEENKARKPYGSAMVSDGQCVLKTGKRIEEILKDKPENIAIAALNVCIEKYQDLTCVSDPKRIGELNEVMASIRHEVEYYAGKTGVKVFPGGTISLRA